jgi:hypothetical protein
MVRWATLVLVLPLLLWVGCSDLREFRGTWRGRGIKDPVLQVNVPDVPDGGVTLAIDRVDNHGFEARLAIAGVLPETAITSLPQAEADVLAGITFGGGPLRVYLAFAAMPDGGGEALVVVALYDDHRVEVRLLRGGRAPLYGIFALTESSP